MGVMQQQKVKPVTTKRKLLFWEWKRQELAKTSGVPYYPREWYWSKYGAYCQNYDK